MGRLAGFRYRDVVRRLRKHGLQFDRQAAGSHEIWFKEATGRYTTIPNHPGDLPEGTLRAILLKEGSFGAWVQKYANVAKSRQFVNRGLHHALGTRPPMQNPLDPPDRFRREQAFPGVCVHPCGHVLQHDGPGVRHDNMGHALFRQRGSFQSVLFIGVSWSGG